MTAEVPAAHGSAPAVAQQRPAGKSPYLDLFYISFTILFFELACIRFFSATVVFLTFFTNIVLIACFLGMSVGLLAASRRRNLIRMVIPLCLVSVSLAWLVLLIYERSGRIAFDVGSQLSPQQIYFGAEYGVRDPSRFMVPIEVVAAVFFLLVALVFVGLGQVMGRAFDAAPDRVRAYTSDVLGSICGIVAFAILSYLWAPPVIWFAVALVVILRFIRPLNWLQVLLSLAVLLIVGLYSLGVGTLGQVWWSPYYKVVFDPQHRTIWTNNVGHQVMTSMSSTGASGYVLPHYLARDAQQRTFNDVLIIGAGSGNDVAAALRAGARHIDAVEIDPVINALGRINHPDRPYADPRVTVHLDDGRSFLHKTNKKYDLVIYALVDSLVLHSAYSSLRLESFLFTNEAIADVKRVLKPDGVFAMYNYFRQGWVVGRLVEMVRDTFGTEPIVISLPYQPEIRASDSELDKITFIFSDQGVAGPRGESTIAAIRQMLQKEEAAPAAPPGSWRAANIRMAHVDTAGIGPVPSDNWPFLYLRSAIIPWLNVRGVVIIAGISLGLLLSFAPVRTIHLNWTMFFLGAGFMLLETKGVVHMALLFGATWIVNSIVFAAILVMILASNLYVLRLRPRKLWPYYTLLVASLAVNALVPMTRFLAFEGVARTVISCSVVFVPIFFAGVIFATIFRDSTQPDLDFGSNVAGIILGGLSEYFSLVLGFNYLLLIAIAFYVLSALLRPRQAGIPAVAGK